ncbi:hypothetical protein QBC37DRAFT_475068 [Rhypophila decipiens]|uniref:ceramidase n=1 Tax=Rhypophila decipiens TaxID=261697 RepID=A0AAN7B497_9PEZI|nr:hypothetical protein QBC37DRAFT_475068 [Rhypophila decipiens]
MASKPQTTRYEVLKEQEPDWEYTPPKFTINLSLPPENRYDHVSSSPAMKEAILKADIDNLFDSIIEMEFLPFIPFGSGPGSAFLAKAVKRTIRGLARIAIGRVYTDEETAELKGISRGTGIPMFLLVCFNVLLDLLLGCTSGGVLFDGAKQQAQAEPSPRGTAKAQDKRRIAHFRTLDWGMNPLRHLVVELEFVRHEGGPVIARTVGYFGYVGVLTGVRQGLSLSLNHRATHDRSTWRKKFSFRWNQLMVLLGRRPSISSTLRFILLNGHQYPDQTRQNQDTRKVQRCKAWQFLDLAQPRIEVVREESEAHELVSVTETGLENTLDMESIITALPMSPSTSAYLIFCTPEEAYSLEIDNKQIVSVQSSATFLATTNHDMADESSPTPTNGNPTATAPTQAAAICGMEEILAESMDRKKAAKRAYLTARRSQNSRTGGIGDSRNSGWPGLSLDKIVGILNYKDIVERDVTHYAVVMDPGSGKILWRRGYWAR